MSPKSGTFHGENGKSCHFPTKDYLVVLNSHQVWSLSITLGCRTPQDHQVWSLSITLGCRTQGRQRVDLFVIIHQFWNIFEHIDTDGLCGGQTGPDYCL